MIAASGWLWMDQAGFAVSRYLLSALWQSSILLLAVWALTWLLRNRPPAVRHAFWLTALLLMPALPAITAGARIAGAPQSPVFAMPAYPGAAGMESANPQSKSPARSELAALPAPSSPSAAGMAPAQSPAALSPAENGAVNARAAVSNAAVAAAAPQSSFASPSPAMPTAASFPWAWGLLAYLAGLACFFAPALVGRYRLRQWVLSAIPITDERSLAAFRRAREMLGLRRESLALESSCAPAPFSTGILRARILLPKGLAASLSDEELQSVALHEMAHVKRRDPLVLSLAALIRAFFFFHPLAWLAGRQISTLAEHSADDVVLDATRKPLPYAKLLARIAERLPRDSFTGEMATGLLFGKSVFLRRVEAILSERRNQVRRLTRLTMAGAIAAMLISVSLAVALPLGDQPSSKTGRSENGAALPVNAIAAAVVAPGITLTQPGAGAVPSGSAAEKEAGAAAPMRYGFKSGKKYVYEVTITANVDETTETRQGLSIYEVKSSEGGKITLNHSGSLKLNRASAPRRTIRPSFDSPWLISDSVLWNAGDLTITDLGKVIKSDVQTPLPYLLGDYEILVLDDLPPESKDKWEFTNPLLVTQKGRSSFPPIPHGPFGETERSSVKRSGEERVSYAKAGVVDDGLRLRKTYELKTDEKSSGGAWREMTGEGEEVFDTKEGVIRSCAMNYELRLNEKNVTVRIPVRVEYHLLDPEESAKRLAELEAKRAEARAEAAKAKEPKALEPGEREKLIKELKSSDQWTARAAADRLARVPKPEKPDDVAQALAALLSDRDDFTRTSAVKALAVWATRDSVPALIKALDDKSIFVRAPAMEALGRLKSKDAAEAVAKQLPNLQGRGEAVKALKAMGAIAEQAVIPYLKDRDTFVRNEACKILEEIGTAKSVAALEDFASNGNVFDKQAAEKAIKAIKAR
ncbi:MAG: HEAT repeat domain-containing protein [Candidatus Sumerlaeota bacterium]|nr:HEAT repeat domain-containing protein [Candidatus Sumerlaeota bacterium]